MFSGAIVGNITTLNIWYDLLCPNCGNNTKRSMRVSVNDLRPRVREGSLKCKKCKAFNTFEAYFGIEIND